MSQAHFTYGTVRIGDDIKPGSKNEDLTLEPFPILNPTSLQHLS